MAKPVERESYTTYAGPTYNEWTPEQRRIVDEHVERQVGYRLNDLRLARDWPDGYVETLPSGYQRGWEKLCADVAQTFLTLATEGWSKYDEATLKALYLRDAPTSTDWTRANLLSKWDGQRGREATKGGRISVPRFVEPESAAPATPDLNAGEVLAAEMNGETTVLDEVFLGQVRDVKFKMLVNETAKIEYAREKAGTLPPFDAGTLADILARPAEAAMRMEGLWPWNANLLLTAQFKTGKTTMVLNMARSLLTGEAFLGRFSTIPVEGSIAFLNYEVSARQLARWADEHGIDRDRMFLVNLRGRRNPLGDLTDRANLAAMLKERNVETVICDPFGRAYTGVSQNDPGEVTSFLTGLDTFAREEAGARDLVLTCHAGWNQERTRGSSALNDWADSLVTLTKKDAEGKEDDDAGQRYFSALGRDVEVEEDALDFDTATRTLSLMGTGSRRASSKGSRVKNLATTVQSVLIANGSCNQSDVRRHLATAGVKHRKGEEIDALNALVADGLATVVAGAKNAKIYTSVQAAA